MPGEKPVVFRENSNGANGNAFDAQGRLYTCESRTRRVVRMDKKGEIEVLADKWEGKRLNAPNDIVVRKDGHVYFTDPAFGKQADARELDFYGVYHITPKEEMRLVAKPAGRPNGIALSHNGRVLYVANSDEHLVRAYDLDRNGELSNERVVISGMDGVPDGIRVDEEGNIYVAATGVMIFDARRQVHRDSRHGRDAGQLRVRRRRSADALHHGKDVGLPRAARCERGVAVLNAVSREAGAVTRSAPF